MQVGASNEMPESEELDALYDRFLIRRTVSQVGVVPVWAGGAGTPVRGSPCAGGPLPHGAQAPAFVAAPGCAPPKRAL